MRRVAGHVAPARADPRSQGVAEGHVVPPDKGVGLCGFTGSYILDTLARGSGTLMRLRLRGISARMLLLSLRSWEAGKQGGQQGRQYHEAH